MAKAGGGGKGGGGGAFHKFSEDNEADSHNALQPYYQAWLGSLTPEETWALQQYCGMHYKDLNYLLRKGLFDPNKFPDSMKTKMAAGLDEALAKAPGTPRNMMLFRGFGDETLYNAVAQGTMQKGAILTDPAFMSTAPKRSTAVKFETASPVFYQIRAPRGSPGAYVSFPGVTGYMHETEFLMPRNTPLRVTGFRMQNFKGTDVAVYDVVVAK